MSEQSEKSSAVKEQTAPEPDDPRKPQAPPKLHGASWKLALRKAPQEFLRDQCTDLAAGLTYYSVLALFPGLLAVVSLLGVVGQAQQTTAAMLDLVQQIAPGGAADQLRAPIESMTTAQGSGITLVIGILGALWSASGYVGAFGRAMNRMYEIDEGRPIWKLRPWMLLWTLVIVILVCLVLVGLVVSGPIAEGISRTIGLGSTGLTVFNIVKWPIMLLVVVGIVALLYWATPNVRQPKFRWMSLGAFVAIGVWVLTSALFGLYVANFANYNKTYGALGGVIIFLLWLWLTNLALMFGAELDAEVERARQLQAGIAAEETLQLPPRDTTQSEKVAEKREAIIEDARELRENASDHPHGRDGASGDGIDKDVTDKAGSSVDRGTRDAGDRDTQPDDIDTTDQNTFQRFPREDGRG